MKKFLAASLLFVTLVTPVRAQEVRVVTSIKPVHSLVASVMAGVDMPHLLVANNASAHTYSMKPSDAEALQAANVVFWIGEDMETFLRSALVTLAADAKVVALAEAPGLTTLSFREGGAFDAHAHELEEESHHEDEHDDESHDEHDTHDEHDEHDGHDGHDEHDGHQAHDDHEAHNEHDEIDMHVWLDPQNAKVMLKQIEQTLSAVDPANAETYQINAAKTASALNDLTNEIDTILIPVKQKPFIVFHDAYQYFEKRFDVIAAGSITVNPDAIPGVQRLVEIRDKVKQLGVTCVFSEPQFEPKLVTLATEGTKAKTGTLDPLGAQLSTGPNLYFELMRNMATAISECLER